MPSCRRCLSGGAFVGLDFDATVAWPAYNWMGVAKAALQSTNRYLAELGPRASAATSSPPGRSTMAAKSIPGFSKFEDIWDDRAPIGWDVTDPSPSPRPVSRCVSDWFPATTG